MEDLVSFRCSPNLKRALKKEAEDQNQELSEFMRNISVLYLIENHK